MRIHTTHTRDAALGQLRRVNRWIIAGSIGLTAVLADVAANAFPGKTIKTPATKPSGSRTQSNSSSATPAKPLAPPAHGPEAATEPAPSQESAPSEPAAPSQESAPPQESQQPTPSPESSESAPSQQSTPTPEASGEAAPESSGPVVSGGS
jgi:hypothetical protein